MMFGTHHQHLLSTYQLGKTHLFKSAWQKKKTTPVPLLWVRVCECRKWCYAILRSMIYHVFAVWFGGWYFFFFSLLILFIVCIYIFLYGTLSRRFGTIPTSHHQCHYYGTVIISVAIAAMSPPVIIIVTIAAPASVSLLRHCHHQCHYCCTVIISVTIAALSSSVISVTNTAPSPAECTDKAEDT